MSQHSLYSPSSAHRYMRCPGSVALNSQIEDVTSEYAKEGTAAHMLAEKVLTKELPSAKALVGAGVFFDDGESWLVDEAMAEYVQEYADTINNRIEDLKLIPGVVGVDVEIELRLDFSDIIGVEDQFGTGDVVLAAIYNNGSVSIFVEDLKYGLGVTVEALGNEQLLTYGAAAAAYYEMAGYDTKDVTVAIHQPRKKNFQQATYNAEEIETFGEQLKMNADVAQADIKVFEDTNNASELHLTPGEKQCRWCNAKATCPALRNEVTQTVFEEQPLTEFEFEDLEPVELSDNMDWMGIVLNKISVIKMWCNTLETRAYALAMEGRDIPGFKVVEGRRGNASWSDEEEAEQSLKDMRFKREDMYKTVIISPTQAKKILKDSPRRWAKLEVHTFRKDGAPTLVPLDDKRPVLNLQALEDDFEPITEETWAEKDARPPGPIFLGTVQKGDTILHPFDQPT